MISGFADKITEKIYNGETLSRKEINKLGSLNLTKAYARLIILNNANEKDLILAVSLKYHSLGRGKYSIDADARNSPWRITFQWDNEELSDVTLVKIEDTH